MEQQLAQFQKLYDQIYSQITSFIINYSFQIVGAIIVLLLGLVLARKLGGFTEKFMVTHNMDVTLSRFTATGVRIIVMAMVGVIALGKLGISVAPFVAAIGAVSLGAGLALQGLLSNYGAGISIIITRPFVVGDTITVKGVTGIVRQVKLAATVLANDDDVRILIPNHHIVGEIIHNSSNDTIIELTVDIDYHCDPLKAAQVIRTAIAAQPSVNKSRPPQVGIESFGANGYTIGYRFWAGTDSLYLTRCQTNAAIYQALTDHAMVIAVPQREVRLQSVQKS